MQGTASRGLRLAWAKSWPRGHPVERWSPLWVHLDDTALVAGLLWDEWMAPSVRATVARAMPGGDDDARRLLVWLAGVHDVGKATPAFAVDVAVLADRMYRGGGLTWGGYVVNDRRLLRHEIAGAAALDGWIAARTDLPEHRRRQFTCAVAGHHGRFDDVRLVRAVRAGEALYGDERWAEVRERLLDRAAQRAGVEERLPAWAGVRLPQSAQMLLTAAVVMADWIASDESLFPLRPVEDVPDVPALTVDPTERVLAGWRRLNLGRPWEPASVSGEVGERFVARFPWATAGPRPEQVGIVRAAETTGVPGLMIVEAPMGIGKTEAGLLAAEVMAARAGSAGCLVALPTQATSNAIFSRMHRWLESVPTGSGLPEDRPQVFTLLHGKAALNDEFMHLPHRSVDLHAVGDDAEVGRGVRSTHLAVWHEWFRGRKRAALAPFVAGTIDQVLFGALRAKHVMLRQLSLASKVVVIDEVHAADVYMSRFLDRALEWLGAAGAPVILMSATLPAGRRADLYAAYERGRCPGGVSAGAESALRDDIGYPVVTTTGYHGPEVTRLTTSTRTTEVTLHRLGDDLDILRGLLDERLVDGGCAVVIRDTVARAQETADALAPMFDVTVAHAQFLAVDRAANDVELLREFGPPGPEVARPRSRRVVVATQVVEQSLDLDFDLMVTDIAPVDLVVQRLGRLHRHERGPGQSDRPSRLRRAECWITGVDWTADVPRMDEGATAVYGAWSLLAAAHVLGPHLDGLPLRLPQHIAPLVQSAYADHLSVPPGWEDDAEKARAKDVERRAARESAANSFALAEVGTPGTSLYGLSRAGHGDIDEDAPRTQGYVRDGADSVEVVVVQRGADGVDRIPDWVPDGGEVLPLRHVPLDRDQARCLARCTLRLPAAMTRESADLDEVLHALEQNYFAGWQETPLLSGQLALVLDDDARARLARWELVYDRARGLLVWKDEQ